MVASQKDSQGLEEFWNNLYAGYIQRSCIHLSPSTFTQGRASVGVLLTVLKCHTLLSTLAENSDKTNTKLEIGV